MLIKQKSMIIPLQRRSSKENAYMVFHAISIYTTAAKRVSKYQKSMTIKLYFTAKTLK